jgi:hypothetical protein
MLMSAVLADNDTIDSVRYASKARSFPIVAGACFAAATRLRYHFSVGLVGLAILFSGMGVLGASPAAAQSTVKTITLSMQPQTAISPLIYGANYVWTTTPESQFPAWINQMTGYAGQPSAPVSFFRYPGGIDGEWYDWANNSMYSGTGSPSYTEAGEPPDEFLDDVQPLATGMATRAASFVLSTRNVIDPYTPAQLPLLISQQLSNYLSIIGLYQSNVRYWEIGNEWWLQNGAGNDTAPLSSNPQLTTNLTRYAQLVAAAVPQIKGQYPNAKIYVTADWTTAGLAAANDEFVQLRKLVGPASWALVDGISIHPYCGTTVTASLCTSIPAQVKAIQQETGKSDIFASEWSISLTQSINDFGIQNASATVSVLQSMALAGINEATYWPSIGSAPGIALTTGTNLTPTGMLFRAMSLLYEGEAIPANVTDVSGPAGQTLAVAAENKMAGKNGIAVIIPTNGDGLETINVSLAGTGMSRVSASSVLYAQYPNSGTNATTAYMVPLTTTMVQQANGSLAAQFVLNPGTQGRGSSWEIALLELQ